MDSVRTFDFKDRMNAAMESVKRILNVTKNPVFPDEAAHEYQDKFVIVEKAANDTLRACIPLLASLGLDQERQDLVQKWTSQGQVVTMRFECEEVYNFVKSITRKESSPEEQVSTNYFGFKKIRKTVTVVKEEIWDFTHVFQVKIFAGNNTSEAIVIQERSSKTTLTTRDTQPSRSVHLPKDFVLSDLFAFIKDSQYTFSIDRMSKNCHTPCRNDDVKQIDQALCSFGSWLSSVSQYFEMVVRKMVSMAQDESAIQMPVVDSIPVPVFPLFSSSVADMKEEKGTKPMFTVEETELLFGEQISQISKACTDLKQSYVDPEVVKSASFFTSQEAQIVLLSKYLTAVLEAFLSTISYVEGMLESQLIDAIGKAVTPQIIHEYMDMHNRKFFRENVMHPFSYDVKQAGFAPEGNISIVMSEGDAVEKEVVTFSVVRNGIEAPSMGFRLSASVTVEMQGPQVFHGYLAHQFSNSAPLALKLIARARQFSSFVLLVGRIAAKNEFSPAQALILQNKDCAIIPLLLEPLPSAKAFRDAIESLSPEQQDFARSIRAMQLESTLFAVAVVEIKPQLEFLLNLPRGSLTKEIKLTQDLMKLFVQYQVPCDLLSFDGDETASVKEKVLNVEAHTKSLLEMVRETEAAEEQERLKIKQEKLKAEEAVWEGRYRLLAESFSRHTCLRNVERNVESEFTNPVAKCMSISAEEISSQSSSNLSSWFGKVKSKSQPKKKRRESGPKGSSMVKMGGGGSSPPAPPPPPSNMPALVTETVMSPPQLGGILPDLSQQQLERESEAPNQASVYEETIVQAEVVEEEIDYTRVPSELDERIEAIDSEAALRPTKIKVGEQWTLETFRNLLTRTGEKKNLGVEELTKSKGSAMDLIDAITRSGDLPLIACQLHIMVATTHCFDQTVMDCLIKRNMNPIEHIERSSLIMATSLFRRPADDLVTCNANRRLADSRFTEKLKFSMTEKQG